MSTAPVPQRALDARWLRRPLGVGLVAAAACVVGAVLHPAEFLRVYLAAYLFFLGLSLGSMAILLIYRLTGGAWGFLLRRILEAATRTIPLLAVLFTPIAVGLQYLYLWAQPAAVAVDAKLQHQQFYLNRPYFWIRAAIYFVLWMGIAWLLSRWSRAQDRPGGARRSAWGTRTSGVAAVIYGLTIHFASVDWLMSLQPHYHSTIFGPIVAVGQILSALAFSLLVLAMVVRRSPLVEVVSSDAVNDLGNLLLTFLITWAYLVWFEFMLIWIANLPNEANWFLLRVRGGWTWVAWAIAVLHFVVPFFALLFRRLKRNVRALVWVAGLILVMQLVFLYFQVLPAFPDVPLWHHWLDVVTPLALGGIWLACFVWQLERRPLLARYDGNQQQAIHLRHKDEEEAAREEVLHG